MRKDWWNSWEYHRGPILIFLLALLAIAATVSFGGL